MKAIDDFRERDCHHHLTEATKYVNRYNLQNIDSIITINNCFVRFLCVKTGIIHTARNTDNFKTDSKNFIL